MYYGDQAMCELQVLGTRSHHNVPRVWESWVSVDPLRTGCWFTTLHTGSVFLLRIVLGGLLAIETGFCYFFISVNVRLVMKTVSFDPCQ